MVLVDTREQKKLLNAAIQERLVSAGQVDSDGGLLTDAGDYLHVGDRVATRCNDRDLGVANRETWTIQALTPDGGLVVTAAQGDRILPKKYATTYVELAYAATVHSAQGETVTTAHALIGEETTAAGAYVAMTRGREDNTAHLVAETPQQARAQWIRVFGNDRADLGPAAAAEAAAEAIERYGPRRPDPRQPDRPRPPEERLAPTTGAHRHPGAPSRDMGPSR